MNANVFQPAAILTLAISIASLIVTFTFYYTPNLSLFAIFEAFIIIFCVLFTLIIDRQDGNIMNGCLVALYLSCLTQLDLNSQGNDATCNDHILPHETSSSSASKEEIVKQGIDRAINVVIEGQKAASNLLFSLFEQQSHGPGNNIGSSSQVDSTTFSFVSSNLPLQTLFGMARVCIVLVASKHLSGELPWNLHKQH